MIRGLIFDLNGTLIDILTNEGDENVYRTMANLLSYQGISLSPERFKELYFDLNKQQRRDSSEEYPEFDVVRIFREILFSHATDYTRRLSPTKQALLPELLAEAFRAATRFQLKLYPGVREVLLELRTQYKLAAVSDGQRVWAEPELNAVGLTEFFPDITISSDFGFRKPDIRMFEPVLSELNLAAEEVAYVGNDLYRDVFGAHQLGMKTIFFRSNQGDWHSHGTEPDYIIYDFRELPAAVHFLSRD